MHNLFVYGSLQLPEVLSAVTGTLFTAYPAQLHGYSRHRLRERSFPGIRPNPAASVEGLLWLNVDAASLAKLDAFEDDFYQRETVRVSTADGREWAALAYVVRAECAELLLAAAWDLEEFKAHDLPRFLLAHV